MESVKAEIAAVEVEIKKVQQEIDDVENQLKTSKTTGLLPDDIAYLRKKEDHLRQEKDRLRQEKDRLRQEKDRLHEKELIYLKRSSGLSVIAEDRVSRDGFESESAKDPLQLIREMHNAVVTRDRATPMKSPADHGNDEYVRLRREGKVRSFESIESKASVLSKEDAEKLLQVKTEHHLVAFMTPHLESIFKAGENSTTVVVNSERYPWLKTSSSSSKKKYDQMPDLFVCHRATYFPREPFESTDESLLSARRDSDTFGQLADWKLRRFLYVVCEAKKKIDNASLGEVINYASHISFEDGGPVTVRSLLFDTKECWLVECVKGAASSIEKLEWTQGGSFNLIQNYALRDPLIEVLDQACSDFELTVDANAFLGEGAFGIVFRVKNNQGKALALKIVPQKDHNVRELWSQKQRTEEAKKKCPHLVVGIEPNGFKHYQDRAAVLLQSETGEHYTSLNPQQILDSMMALHEENVLHGDCRVENVVSVNGQPRWIDFRNTIFLRQNELALEKSEEMRSLKESIARAFYR